jgi:tetratricopeptide (TPR) repeat protein
VADWAAVRRIGAAETRPDAPYPGPRPFLRTEQDRFFGRAIESRALAEFWQDNRIVLAVGPAASGKTSLLHAGVLPILTRNGAHVLPPGRVSGGSTFPGAALPKHNPFTLALLRSWSSGEAPTRLVDLTVRDFIRAYAQCHSGLLYAAIDQVDDLPADLSPRQAHRDAFLAELADAVEAESRLHLLLLAREDGAHMISAKLERAARFELGALTRPGAIEAVTGPVVGTGRSFADEAAEKLVTDLQTSRIVVINGAERHVRSDRVEPSLLQAVCASLWDSLPSDTERITIRDVRLFGDVDRALAAHCSRVVASVADNFSRQVAWVRNWLLRTFITELGTRGMAYEGVVETAGLPNTIARALEDEHLLSVELRSGSRWYELLADRLIQPLRDAVDELPPVVDPADYLAAAERALARGELDVAQRYAEATLRGSADTDLRLHAEMESLLGNIAAERGESAEAKAEAESHYRAAARLFETLRDTPAVASQLAAVGQMLIAQERPEDALDELRAAIDRMPSDPVIQTDLAVALWQLGERNAAVAVLTAVLAMDGGSTVALRARGEILADLGEARQAMLDLDRVTLESRPSTRAARGLALAKLGDQSSANLEVDDAVAEAPWNGAVLLHAARAKALNGDDDAAEELARRAVDANDPGLPPYHREVALQLAGHKHGNSRAKLVAPGSIATGSCRRSAWMRVRAGRGKR